MASNMSRQMFFFGEGLVTCIAFAILSCSNPTHLAVLVGKWVSGNWRGEPKRCTPIKTQIRYDPNADENANDSNR